MSPPPTDFAGALARIDALERQLLELRLAVRQLELQLAAILQALVRSKEPR